MQMTWNRGILGKINKPCLIKHAWYLYPSDFHFVKCEDFVRNPTIASFNYLAKVFISWVLLNEKFIDLSLLGDAYK